MEPTKLRLSTSRINSYLHCPKAYYWTYIEQLAVKKRSNALQVGSLTHMLLQKDAEGTLTVDYINELEAAVQTSYTDNTPEETNAVAKQALELYIGYKRKFENDPYNIDSVEVHLEYDTGEYILYTRLDALVRSTDNRLWRSEYKTSAKIDSAYLSGLKGGLQAGISYLVASSVLPEKINGTIYSILVKTKVPQYERMMVLAEKVLIDRTKQCVEGVFDGIKNQRFYPSMQCHFYNRECDYLPLCKNDTPNTREAFYEKRVDFFQKPASERL